MTKRCPQCGKDLTGYVSHEHGRWPGQPTHRFRPCGVCGLSPDVHNTNRGPGEFVGHEYK